MDETRMDAQFEEQNLNEILLVRREKLDKLRKEGRTLLPLPGLRLPIIRSK